MSISLKRKNWILLIDFLMRISFGLSNFSYPAISGIVATQFGLSNTQSGLITSSFFAAYAIMQIPGGYVVDRLGAPKSLFVSSLIMSLGPIIFVLDGNFTTAIVSRVTSGIGAGVVFPAMIRLLSLWYERNELDRPMSIFATAGGISQIIASWILPLLVIDSNWRPPLVFTVIFSITVSLMGIFPILWRKQAIVSDVSKKVKIDVRGLFTRNMFALMLPNFAALVVIYGVFAWTSDYLVTTIHLSYQQAGEVLASIGFASIIGSYSGGLLDKVLGKRTTILLSAVLSVAFTILLGFSRSWFVAAFSIFGIGFSSVVYFAAVFSLIPFASKQGLEAAGLTFGVFNTLSNIGTFISPLIFGLLLDSTGSFTLGFVTIGAIASVGILGPFIMRMGQFSMK